jgi:hypothetical protein
VGTGTPDTSPPTGSSTLSPSITSRRSCSQSASRPVDAQRTSPPGDGVLQRPCAGPDRLRRPPRRGPSIPIPEGGLQPIQARQRHVHLRAGSAPARQRRERNRAAPGVVRTKFGAEDPNGFQRLLVPFAKPFMKVPNRARRVRSTWPPPTISNACRVSTSPTTRRSGRRNAVTTSRPPPDFGRSAPDLVDLTDHPTLSFRDCRGVPEFR